MEQLDRIGFDVGGPHVSVLGALFVRPGHTGRRHRLRPPGWPDRPRQFARLSKFDPAQRVLAEKLAGIAIWAVAILIGVDILEIDLTGGAIKDHRGAGAARRRPPA